MSAPGDGWRDALAFVIDETHLATADDLPAIFDRAVRPLGLSVELYICDLAQRTLSPVGGKRAPVDVDTGPAGAAYQHSEVIADAEDSVLWVPILDGTERVGVLRVRLPGRTGVDDQELRRRLWTLAGLAGHLVMTKFGYSDLLHRLRSNNPLSAASELLWQLLPPRTMATRKVMLAALLEPYARVAGDAYDYSAVGDVLDLAVFDALGHDMQACLSTALAITGVRNGRRAGDGDLAAIAGRADELIATPDRRHRRFVTAFLARFDAGTGQLRYLNAGHPPPLLLRGGSVVKELVVEPRVPLGLWDLLPETPAIGEEQLEPEDRLLVYSDGITEARSENGEFFGRRRLVEFAERAAADRLSAPETLRRLGVAVLEHQNGRLQDDATLLLLDWSAMAPARMFPSAD